MGEIEAINYLTERDLVKGVPLIIPVLILVGDEDSPCIQPALFMKENFPKSGLVTFPQSGHAINIEEPSLFNRIIENFLAKVDQGDWALRTNLS